MTEIKARLEVIDGQARLNARGTRAEYEEQVKKGLINPKDATIVNDVAFVYDEVEINDAIKSAICGLQEPGFPFTDEGNAAFRRL